MATQRVAVPVNGPAATSSRPLLLYDDECGVCRYIAGWVRRSARAPTGPDAVDLQPIGEDPVALHALNPSLSIWDAYDTIHLLMPDGSMRLGGQAIATLLRLLPNTRWYAGIFTLRILGWQPFQQALDLAYAALSAIRPVFGCESCGRLRGWMRPFAWVAARVGVSAAVAPAQGKAPAAAAHFTPRKPGTSLP